MKRANLSTIINYLQNFWNSKFLTSCLLCLSVVITIENGKSVSPEAKRYVYRGGNATSNSRERNLNSRSTLNWSLR